METTLTLVACVVAGLVIGSFLTVVVDRVPRGASVVAPPSACGSCGLRLGPKDLVPVLSWLVLRGRCRQCGARIGIEPIVIELATATVFVLFGLRFGASPELVARMASSQTSMMPSTAVCASPTSSSRTRAGAITTRRWAFGTARSTLRCTDVPASPARRQGRRGRARPPRRS